MSLTKSTPPRLSRGPRRVSSIPQEILNSLNTSLDRKISQMSREMKTEKEYARLAIQSARSICSELKYGISIMGSNYTNSETSGSTLDINITGIGSRDEPATVLSTLSRYLEARFYVTPEISADKPCLLLNDKNGFKKTIVLTADNRLDTRTALLFKGYMDTNDKCRQLSKLIKDWARKSGFIGPDMLSGEAWTVLVIYFLQVGLDDKQLPNAQKDFDCDRVWTSDYRGRKT